MPVLSESAKLTLSSGPCVRRSGSIPMFIAIVIGFAFCLAWLGVGLSLLCQGRAELILFGLTIMLGTSVYCIYMGFLARKLIADGKRQYFLELTESEAVLLVMDPVRKLKSTQMVLLDDVNYAEYYPYRDSAAVILHAPYTSMEIPLWPLGGRGEDVIDFLRGRGLRVIDVQMDDPIPDN